MRRFLLGVVALLFALSSDSASMAQGPGPVALNSGGVAVVYGNTANLVFTSKNYFEVHRLALYINGPLGYIPATSIEGKPAPIAPRFSVRGWWEGGRMRVVVYAAILYKDSPYGQIEDAIATRLVSVNQTAEFDETYEWNAAPIFVSVRPLSTFGR
jgi:hypothetical protein